jgi:phage-related protein
MNWTAFQYRRVWDEAYALCDDDTQEGLDRRLDLLLEHGNLAGRPITAPLGDGIFELRANAARMLFYFGASRSIVFVHCIIKKTRTVPTEDVKLAKKRRAEIIAKGAKTNALPN